MTTLPSSRVDAALALLRVVIGGIFAAHGAQKLFVFGFPAWPAHLRTWACRSPEWWARRWRCSSLGGLALVLGLFTRPVAAALAIDMLGAMAFVHLRNGFFLPAGAEFALALFGGAAALVLGGAGDYSVDGVRARRTIG